MRYRAAVVGCGRIGLDMELDVPPEVRPATHAAAFSMNPRTELAALVDINKTQRKRAAKRYPGVACFADYHKMLEAVRPDIVAVATGEKQHRPVVEAAAKAGVRAIVCEKPIAPTLKDATLMIKACRKADALLFVNHTRRFDPLIRSARAAVAHGSIGEILQATSYYTAGVRNTGTHLLDLLRFLLGDASWVIGIRNPRGACPPRDEGVDGLIKFRSGTRAVLQFLDKDDYSIFDVRLYGQRGTLTLARFGYKIERLGLKPRADFPKLKELDLDDAVCSGRLRSFMRAMVDHVVACLDGEEVPVSRGEDGRAALELVEALWKSAKDGGGRVVLGPQGRSTR